MISEDLQMRVESSDAVSDTDCVGTALGAHGTGLVVSTGQESSPRLGTLPKLLYRPRHCISESSTIKACQPGTQWQPTVPVDPPHFPLEGQVFGARTGIGRIRGPSIRRAIGNNVQVGYDIADKM